LNAIQESGNEKLNLKLKIKTEKDGSILSIVDVVDAVGKPVEITGNRNLNLKTSDNCES
jgi:hypothetical protein